jgi:hypothetical protein
MTAGLGIVALLLFYLPFVGCGKKSTPLGKNLLTNGSFEKIDGGMPSGWEIRNFRGLEGMEAATHGIDDALAYDGDRSFYFKAQDDTKRFYMLSQEVEVRGAKKIRLRGAVKTVDCFRREDQYPQANFALTFYDEDRNRFKSTRFYDKKSKAPRGSTEGWEPVDVTFRVPRGTRYIAFHCVLGMSGTAWFDNASLDVPAELPWNRTEEGHFVYHWLDEKEYPDESHEFQEGLYLDYAKRLGIPEAECRTVYYYLYPDTASIRKALGIKTGAYVNWDDAEIHLVHPVDNHEIAHILTHPYGTLPTALAEGTAYYLIGDLSGQLIQPTAQRLLAEDKLPPLELILDPIRMGSVDPVQSVIAGASFVGFLLEFGGPQQFLDLHQEVKEGGGYHAFAESFERVYKQPLAEVEQKWREILRGADFSEFQQQAE